MKQQEEVKTLFKIHTRCRAHDVVLVFANRVDPAAYRSITEQIMNAYRERQLQEVK